MIVKFHQKSERIKGLSFHPKRPWLLAGLHTGNIQLWDYRLGQVIDNFEEHDGPVRSVQFHPTLGLFVSGSDDLTVRVWNYKTKKCQFVLRGHLDFVRCVNFHPELPWVISGSDDQTARIWNYQSRQMIAIVTGHSHYIMQCQFHPTQDLLITCSLDQTIRLWSIAQLKRKFTTSRSEMSSELELVQILEGHNQGVNWCAFHPNQNLIVTSSDDKKIKTWKFNETRSWEIDSLSGHNNNVSSAVFHSKADVIISNSEDKTQRVWDVKKKIEVDCFTNKELDRFWVVAAHPDNYYFAGGSDSALYIFTLYKDRPPMDLINSQFLCIGYQKQILLIDIKTNQEKILKNLQDLSNIQDNILQDNIEQVQYNTYDTTKTQILVRLKQNQHNKSKNTAKFVIYEQNLNHAQMFMGKAAAFIGKCKVVRSKESSELEIYNYETDQHTLINYKSDKVFPFAGGKILFYQDNTILIVDPLTTKIIAQCECTDEFANIKKISCNSQLLAIQTKKGLHIFTKSLQRISFTNEKISIKSILWLSDSQNLILYSTKVHLKFLLMNGQSGILKSTENIMYLVQIQHPVDQSTNFKVIFMDNQWQLQNNLVNCQEMLFKLALYDRNLKQIQNQLHVKQRFGDSIIAYLYQQKYASLAINLVDDKKAKFQLALGSNNLEIAYKSCQDLKDRDSYQSLYEEALRQGNHSIAEVSLQSLRSFEQLTFLYTMLGHKDKLNKMLKITKQRQSKELAYHNALLLGDLPEKIEIIKQSGLTHLANLASLVHGFQHDPKKIHPEDMEWINNQNRIALYPPQPIIRDQDNQTQHTNWPHNYIAEEDLLALQGNKETNIQEELSKQEQKDDVLINTYDASKQQDVQASQEQEEQFEDCQWGLDDGDIVQDQESPTKLSPLTKTSFDNKALCNGYPDYKKMLIPGEQVVVEQYDNCKQLLTKQIAISDITPMKVHMKKIALTSILEVSQIPFLMPTPLILNDEGTERLYIHSEIKQLLKLGYKYTTEGKFIDTLNTFRQILQQIPLSRNTDSLPICLNYIIAMKCELAKKQHDLARQIELACYMAMCELQPAHRTLTLRAAMSFAYKNKNFITAAQLARFLIKLLQAAPPNAPYAKIEVVENARKVLKACEQQGINEHKINFHESYLSDGIDKLCSQKLVIVDKAIKCPFDKAAHSSRQICAVCEMCMVGEETIGFKV